MVVKVIIPIPMVFEGLLKGYGGCLSGYTDLDSQDVLLL